MRGQLDQAIAMICGSDPDRGYMNLRHVLDNLCLRHAGLAYLELHNPQEHVALGDALERLRRYEEAIAHLTTALTQDSNHHFARHGRALDYLRTGRISKAQEDLAILSRVWPKGFDEFPHSYWLGDLDRARDYFEPGRLTPM